MIDLFCSYFSVWSLNGKNAWNKLDLPTFAMTIFCLNPHWKCCKGTRNNLLSICTKWTSFGRPIPKNLEPTGTVKTKPWWELSFVPASIQMLPKWWKWLKRLAKGIFLTKLAFSKYHFSQSSQFEKLIFHKIHIMKYSSFTKAHFEKNIFDKIHV